MAQWRSCTAPVSGWLHYADHGVAPMCRSRAGALHPSGARRFIPAGVGNTCPSLFIPPSRSDLSTGANGWSAVWPGCDAVGKRAAGGRCAGCFHKRLFFRVLFISPAFLDDCAHPRDFPANPRKRRGAWRNHRGERRIGRKTWRRVQERSPELQGVSPGLRGEPPVACARWMKNCAGWLENRAGLRSDCAGLLDDCATRRDACAGFLGDCATRRDVCAGCSRCLTNSPARI